MESHFVDVFGVRTHYLEAGSVDRPLVILLHGGGLDSARLSWTPLIGALSGEFHVLAPDWPGYGESDRPQVAYDLPYYVDFFAQFVKAMQINQPFSLAGISMGGGAALGYALQHSEAVRKLILIDSYGLQDRAPYHFLSYLFIITPGINELTWSLYSHRSLIKWGLSGLLSNPKAVTPELIEQAYQETQHPALGMAWRRFQKNEALWNRTKTSYMGELERLNVPTLIIHGAKDSLVPVRYASEAQQRLPQAHLELIEGAGHWAQRDQPDVVNRLVLDFLSE